MIFNKTQAGLSLTVLEIVDENHVLKLKFLKTNKQIITIIIETKTKTKNTRKLRIHIELLKKTLELALFCLTKIKLSLATLHTTKTPKRHNK